MKWLNYADDLLLLIGCACIVTGVAMLSVPAALVVSGVLLIGLAVIVGKIDRTDGKGKE